MSIRSSLEISGELDEVQNIATSTLKRFSRSPLKGKTSRPNL